MTIETFARLVENSQFCILVTASRDRENFENVTGRKIEDVVERTPGMIVLDEKDVLSRLAEIKAIQLHTLAQLS